MSHGLYVIHHVKQFCPSVLPTQGFQVFFVAMSMVYPPPLAWTPLPPAQTPPPPQHPPSNSALPMDSLIATLLGSVHLNSLNATLLGSHGQRDSFYTLPHCWG